LIHDTREAPDALIYVRSGDEKVIRNPFEVDEELSNLAWCALIGMPKPKQRRRNPILAVDTL
jgi:hypothetical protein